MKGVPVRWFLGLGLIAALLVSACAAPKSPAPASEKPNAAAPASQRTELSRQQQLVEGAKAEQEVVLWTNNFPDEGNKIKNAFEGSYPFLKFTSWDSPTGTNLLNKMIEEGKIGKYSVDLVILTGGDALLALETGLLAEYDWPNVKGWPYQPSNSYLRALAGSSFGPVYNTNLLSKAEAPKSFEDLKDPRWRGRAVMTTSARDTPLFFAYHWRKGETLDWEKSFDFWKTVVKNAQPKVGSGVTGQVEMTAAGESAIFLWAAYSAVVRYIWKGAPVAPAVLEYAPTVSRFIMLPKDVPHPNAAKLLADFLTSAEGATLYADQMGLVGYHPESANKARANVTLRQFGVEWIPLPVEQLTTENALKSSSFWNSNLGLR